MNVPVAVLAIVLVLALVPEITAEARARLDLIGLGFASGTFVPWIG
ncbi:hypothetical protein GCM10011575_25540 [Microlunatus endophyticus]|uniref:Uncharacterized protein n=1 Tax=Microlunatus endophyticus TaxID=1716077 RepID=A0A917SB98_9ACTN|nr:hypothetical protein [Microlunatus endophyticus]GGL65981.1 hypothetical protein GCM10011575_25540 [Microlunatus endophyticus]